MRAKWWLMVALAVGLAGSAWAQEGGPQDPNQAPPSPAKIGEKAPVIRAETWDNVEGTMDLEKYQGRIVLILFFRSNDPGSVEALDTLKKIYEQKGKSGVAVIALTSEPKTAAESVVKGKDLKFPVGYGSKTNEWYNVPAPPMVYMIDTYGLVADRFHPADRLTEKLDAQITKTPPAGMDETALRRKFDVASAHISKGEFGRAYTFAKELQDIAPEGNQYAEMAKQLLKQINEKAEKWLDEAKELAEKEKWEEASKILSQISVRFAGTDLAGKADNEIGRLMGNREVKKILTKDINNAKGQLLNDRATDCALSRQFIEALKLFRQVTEEYDGTDAAKDAEEAIDKIKTDPDAQTIIAKRRAEEQADRWLDIAARFEKVEMWGKAREYYQRIIDEHPTSVAASKAKDKLSSLPEPEPEPEPEPVPAEDDEVSRPGDEPGGADGE